MDSTNGISIIICCYNSTARLPKTLEYIARQKIAPGIFCEVVIVDNNSSDNTSEAAADEWQKYNLPFKFKVVKQPLAGLSHAREMGIDQCTYEYIIFCDDDNWLCDTYINDAYNILHNNPKVGALGGIGTAVSDVDLPLWFKTYQRSYATGPQGDQLLKKPFNTLYGAGISIKKSIHKHIYNLGYTYMLSGRKGSKVTSGEDGELCMLITIAGYELYYDENLKFKHFLPSSRLTTTYLFAFYNGIGEALVYMTLYKLVINKDKEKLKGWWFYQVIFASLKTIYSYVNINKDPFKRKIDILTNAGYLKELIRIRSSYSSLLKKIEDLKNRIN